MEAVHTYEQKAKQARERNDSIGVRVPPNTASYDYAYANTAEATTAIPAVLKPSSSPPAPLGAFPASPLLQQRDRAKSGPRAAHTVATSSISGNTSVYRKPTVLGVATAAAVIEENVQFVRVDSKGGASRPTPPKSTTIKISMNTKTPPPAKARTAPAVKMKTVLNEAGQTQLRDVQHHRGLYYRTTHDKSATPSRLPSPTKSMPNFTHQYSIEGDSIFGYKVKDALGAIAGASTSVSSSSDDEKPKASTNKPRNVSRQSSPKSTIADRWPWIRKGATMAASTASAISMVIETGLQQAQSYFLLGLKVCLVLYLVVSLWFILDAMRDALFVVSVPLQFVVMLIWAIMGFLGRILGKAAKTLGGKIRILGR
ncbi:hypothetical protein G6514_005216 [Epicoccum nigrum]|nr:hypothetical protein G6514_005216 [Epicoccum nigrum]